MGRLEVDGIRILGRRVVLKSSRMLSQEPELHGADKAFCAGDPVVEP